MYRLKAACNTNDVQVSAVAIITGLTLLAIIGRETLPPWYIMTAAALFWPCVAFVGRLFHHIPERKND
jgi:hypothetical protein